MIEPHDLDRLGIFTHVLAEDITVHGLTPERFRESAEDIYRNLIPIWNQARDPEQDDPLPDQRQVVAAIVAYYEQVYHEHGA